MIRTPVCDMLQIEHPIVRRCNATRGRWGGWLNS
jgi:hypothetical protein